MKILINTPDLSKPGGVANHYKGLKAFWEEEITYNFIGGRKKIPGPIILIYDYIKFVFLCVLNSYDLIILNPSLGKTALNRDALFLKISKRFNIKTLVFFHGWDKEEEKKISLNSASFYSNYHKADAFLILASEFKKKLISWGMNKSIYLTTTKVDDDLLNGFQISEKKQCYNLLFLARIERAKGIFIALEAFQEVKKIYPQARLIVAGDGSALSDAKDWVVNQSIQEVFFMGNLSGKRLIDAFKESTIYLLPTTHGEGMPTSVLEAMAFGLPIITRPVGGLKDFFKNGKMGYMVESLEAADYAEKIIELYNNQEELEKIGHFNQTYAREYFMASKVASQLESIFKRELKTKHE